MLFATTLIEGFDKRFLYMQLKV